MKRVVTIFLVVLILFSSSFIYAEKFNGFNTVNVNIDGKNVEGDVPAIIMNGRTLVPLRLVSETLGMDVKWNKGINTVEIKKKTIVDKDKELDLKEYSKDGNISMEKSFLYSKLEYTLLETLIIDGLVRQHVNFINAYAPDLYYGDQEYIDTYYSISNDYTESFKENVEICMENLNVINDDYAFLLKPMSQEQGKEVDIISNYIEEAMNISGEYLYIYSELKKATNKIEEGHMEGKNPNHDELFRLTDELSQLYEDINQLLVEIYPRNFQSQEDARKH